MDWLTVFFDNNIDLDVAWECGLIDSPAVPLFGATMTKIDLTRLTDSRSAMKFPKNTEKRKCAQAAKAIFRKPGKFIDLEVKVLSCSHAPKFGRMSDKYV